MALVNIAMHDSKAESCWGVGWVVVVVVVQTNNHAKPNFC